MVEREIRYGLRVWRYIELLDNLGRLDWFVLPECYAVFPLRLCDLVFVDGAKVSSNRAWNQSILAAGTN